MSKPSSATAAPVIVDRFDQPRGCGTRSPGGLYLVCGGAGRDCGFFPAPLCSCPTCGQGVKPARGVTWIEPAVLFANAGCGVADSSHCQGCPIKELPESALLIWVGEKFYATPGDFMREAREQGISRRVPQLPNDFEVGVTWVFLAHRRAISKLNVDTGEVEHTPGVFQSYRPERVEYVVRGDEEDAELRRMLKRGITPVRVHLPQGQLSI